MRDRDEFDRARAIDERLGRGADRAVAVVLIGFVSLGTEIVLLLATWRHMQSAADAGTLAAARRLPPDHRREALALAADAGFVDGRDGTSGAANSPPSTGNHAGNGDAIEVLNPAATARCG